MVRSGEIAAAGRLGIAFSLTSVGGYVDAVGYIALFQVFTANMSGNSIHVGMRLRQLNPLAQNVAVLLPRFQRWVNGRGWPFRREFGPRLHGDPSIANGYGCVRWNCSKLRIATAADADNCLAMLVRRRGETLAQLRMRLDQGIDKGAHRRHLHRRDQRLSLLTVNVVLTASLLWF